MPPPLARRVSFTEVIRGLQSDPTGSWLPGNRLTLFSGAHPSFWVNRLRQQGFRFRSGEDGTMQFEHLGGRSTVEVLPARLDEVHPDLHDRYRGPIDDVPEMDEVMRSWDGIQAAIRIIRYLGTREEYETHAGDMLEWFFAQANIMFDEGRTKNRRARAFLAYAGFGYNRSSFTEFDPEHVLAPWRPGGS